MDHVHHKKVRKYYLIEFLVLVLVLSLIYGTVVSWVIKEIWFSHVLKPLYHCIQDRTYKNKILKLGHYLFSTCI